MKCKVSIQYPVMHALYISCFLQTVTYNAAITACEKAGAWEIALAYLGCIGHWASLLGARTLLGAPGRTTRSKKLLGAKGIATRSDRTLLGAPHPVRGERHLRIWALAPVLRLLLSSPATDPVSWSATISACEKAGLRIRHLSTHL